MRPGRLDQHIYVPIPDPRARRAILAASLRKAKVAPNVDLDQLTDMTDTFSGADLAAICQGAAKLSVRRRKEADLEGADTTDWAIMPADFEIAFRGARSSVPKEDQERYLKKKEQVGEGGVTSGLDLSQVTGRYLLTPEATEAKVKRDAEEKARVAALKEERKRKKEALQSAGKSGLRSTSVQAAPESKSGRENPEPDAPPAPAARRK